jgi:hypothetical protein
MLNTIKRKGFQHGVPNSLYYVFTQEYNTVRAQDQFVPTMFLSRSLRNTTIAITTYQEQKTPKLYKHETNQQNSKQIASPKT